MKGKLKHTTGFKLKLVIKNIIVVILHLFGDIDEKHVLKLQTINIYMPI